MRTRPRCRFWKGGKSWRKKHNSHGVDEGASLSLSTFRPILNVTYLTAPPRVAGNYANLTGVIKTFTAEACAHTTTTDCRQQTRRGRSALTVRAILRQQGGLQPGGPFLLFPHELLERQRVARQVHNVLVRVHANEVAERPEG